MNTSSYQEHKVLETEMILSNAIKLADDHRQHCSPDCTISFYWLRMLLEKAGIHLTEEEMKHFL